MTQSTPLFDQLSTREHARQVSTKMTGRRYMQIVEVLARRGPLCIFEIAEELGCFDHQISGRFGEMLKLDLIEKTGERRTKPATGCPADVYAITSTGHKAIDESHSKAHR